MSDGFNFEEREYARENRVVVRLKTDWYHTERGQFMRKSLIYLRRQCVGFNWIEEELSQICAEEVMGRITNLNETADGVYEITTCNESRDWETGIIDDYDFKLIQIKDSQ